MLTLGPVYEQGALRIAAPQALALTDTPPALAWPAGTLALQPFTVQGSLTLTET